MPKIKGSPPGVMTTKQLAARLGRDTRNLRVSGLDKFLLYYEVGRSLLYDKQDVADMEYWLFIRDGMIALGHLPHNSPLLPPGFSYDERRRYFEGWLDEDPSGTECPQCGGPAVQDTSQGGPVWCPECGISPQIAE